MKPTFASICLAIGLVGGCATNDDRPETLAYITDTILAPNCATAECHSAMKREYGYAFDNVALAQPSLAGTAGGMTELLIGKCDLPPCSTSPDTLTENDSYLIQVITFQDIYGDRMPYDEAMPKADIELITNWIRDGADGFVHPTVP